MRLTFKIPANQHDRFDEQAFVGSIGTDVVVKDFGDAKILDAVVIEDGKAVLITIDTYDRPTRRGLTTKRMLGEGD